MNLRVLGAFHQVALGHFSREASGHLRPRSSPPAPPLRCGMLYRELNRMETVEAVRRWQAARASVAARVTGPARETMSKYLAAAGTLALLANGQPPNEEQLVPFWY